MEHNVSFFCEYDDKRCKDLDTKKLPFLCTSFGEPAIICCDKNGIKFVKNNHCLTLNNNHSPETKC